MKKIRPVTPAEHLIEIIQQDCINLASAGFAVNVANSATNDARVNISVDGIRQCGTCHDLALAATVIDGRCLRCRT